MGLYIPDNFHPDNGHVIPAMMSKLTTRSEVIPMMALTREFMHADDLAMHVSLQSSCKDAEIYNVGTGIDISIDLADLLLTLLL